MNTQRTLLFAALVLALPLALAGCGNKGSLVLPSAAAIDEGTSASEPAPAAAPSEATADEAVTGSDEPLPEPPPADDDGNG